MSWLGSFLGGGSQGSTALSTVEVQQLLHRLQEATTVAERKKTIVAIKDSSVQQHKKVIGQSVIALVNVIKIDREDASIVKDTIELLTEIMTPKSNGNLPPDSVELQNMDAFLKDPRNVTTILDLLEEKDSSIRYHTIQLLQLLLGYRSQHLQQSILISPMGIARLMDLLRDRDFVRNEALLLLLDLTKSNQEIQKIVTFEGAFEILLSIMVEEGMSDGSIVVEDCLKLINNLLRGNVSNQNYFRETNCIKKLPPLLQLSKSDVWILTDNKVQVLLLTLELLSLLVSGNNPNTQQNQGVIASQNILQLVIPLGLGRVNSGAIRVAALRTLGDLINGHKENSTLFSNATITLESNQSQNSLSRLLVIALNAKDLGERVAAVRLFKCFLYENEEAQLALASTLTPPPTSNEDGASASIGTQLISALLGWENTDENLPYKSWFSSLILGAILSSNQSKELVLRIPLEIPKTGVPMVTLLTKVMRSLTLACRIQASQQNLLVKVGLLRLLAFWVENCSAAVKAFLASPNNLPFLIETTIAPSTSEAEMHATKHVQGLSATIVGICMQFSEDVGQFSKHALHTLIIQRIGVEPFMEKLEQLRKTDHFVRAEQGKTEFELLGQDIQHINFYDYEFTTFFKSIYDRIQRQLKSPPPKNRPVEIKDVKETVSNGSTRIPDSGVNPKNDQYHEAVVVSYKELIRQQDRELESLKKQNSELESKLRTLEELQLRLNSTRNDQNEVPLLKKKLDDSQHEVTKLRGELTLLLQQQEHNAHTAAELNSLAQAVAELERLNGAKDDEITRLKSELQQAKSNVISNPHSSSTSESDTVIQLRSMLDTANAEKALLTQQLAVSDDKLKTSEQKYAILEKEQEDLLMELAQYELQNSNLTAKINLLEGIKTDE